MDVFGYRQFFKSDDLKLLVSARVLIECKQSANPYVLIGREAPKALRDRQPTEHVLRYQHLLTGTIQLDQQRSQIHSVPAWTHLGLHAMPGRLVGSGAGAVTLVRSVSSPRPSNRACGSPAHGSPTPFTGGVRPEPARPGWAWVRRRFH